jgi:Domain of unknown function (DUF4352)
MHGLGSPVASTFPRRIILGLPALLTVLLAVGVAGCGGTTTSTSTQLAPTASSGSGGSGSTEGTAATTAPASGGGWSGTSAYTVGNLELVAGPPTVDPDPQVVSPGSKVVIVQVTARNVGSDIAGYNAGEFKLVDNQGKEHSDFGMTKKQKLSAGVLQPGATATGYLSFELTNEAQPVSLIYRSMGGKGEATWR